MKQSKIKKMNAANLNKVLLGLNESAIPFLYKAIKEILNR